MVQAPQAAPPETKEGEKSFESEVADMLVGGTSGTEAWAAFKKGGAREKGGGDYDVLGVGATLTTWSGKRGVIKRVGQTDLDVEYKGNTYTVRVPEWNPESIKIELSLEGTYADFQRFLRTLNRFPKLLNVSEVGMNKAATGVDRLRFRLNVQLFFLPEEVEKVLAEAKAPIGSAGSPGPGAGGVPGGDAGLQEAGGGGAKAVGD
jgi:hypothetical protein